jgi:ribulose-phosphate 3-epimerase
VLINGGGGLLVARLHDRSPEDKTRCAQPVGIGAVTLVAGNCEGLMVELVPSILSADFARLAEQIAAAERGGGTVVHVDVMDGHFVPNMTIGPPVVASLRKATKLPLDCHLMIDNPNDFIPAFAEAGANWVSVHYEACTHLHRSLQMIAHHGMKPGVVINPATRVDLLVEILPMVHHVLIMSVNPGFGGQEFIPFSLDKIRRLAEMRRELGLAFRIEVDGGVAHDTVAQVVQAGAELLVAGNAVFGAGEPERDARTLLQTAKKAAGESRAPGRIKSEKSKISPAPATHGQVGRRIRGRHI